MKATNIPIVPVVDTIFGIADVNGVQRLRRMLPANLPTSDAAAALAAANAAQSTANTAVTNAATAQGTANTAVANAAAAQGTANTALANAATALAAATAARVFRLTVAASDETTAITTGTAKITFRMPCAVVLTAVRASLTTASSSGTPTININESGVTILSTKITIDANEKTSTTAAIPPVISDANLADDSEITIDIDVAGTGAKGLKVTLIGTW